MAMRLILISEFVDHEFSLKKFDYELIAFRSKKSAWKLILNEEEFGESTIITLKETLYMACSEELYEIMNNVTYSRLIARIYSKLRELADLGDLYYNYLSCKWEMTNLSS
jgi:hypothetical protein